MRVHDLSSLLLLGCLTACGGARPAAPEPSSTSPGAAPDTAPAEPASPPGEAPRGTTPSPGETLDEGVGALRLVLPRLDAFVNAPLPPERPERYTSLREVSRIHVGKGGLRQVALFPDEGSLLVVSDDEATVRVYERSTKRLIGNHQVPGFEKWTTGGVVSWPEGDPVFLAGGVAGLFAFDGRGGARLAQLDSRPVDELRWSPDRRVLTARATTAEPMDPSTLHFLERGAGTTLRELGTLNLPERVDGWDLSADNRLLALTYYPSNDLVVVDLHAGGELFRIQAPKYTGDVAFSPDGRWLAAGGEGLLLVDLLEPARRGFYAHVDNNIGHVRFSPSGDALVTSSYDGQIRVFQWRVPADGGGALELSLRKVLRHAGHANVYALDFEGDGNGLVSASGDQTVRTFRAPSPTKAARADEAGAPSERTFLSLDEWKARDPVAARPLPPPDERTAQERARERAPRPSRIQPGEYACKITTEYRLRECWVREDERGHTVLTFAPDNLLALEGILYDDGPVVRFEGWLTEPSTIVGCRGCERRPLHAVFRGDGRRWQGLLTFWNYYAPHTPPPLQPADVRIEDANDRYPLVLELRRASPPSSSPTTPR